MRVPLMAGNWKMHKSVGEAIALVQALKESLAVIREEAEHLTHLVNNLLDAARIEAGGLPLHFNEVRLDQLAERLVRESLAQAANLPFQSLKSLVTDLSHRGPSLAVAYTDSYATPKDVGPFSYSGMRLPGAIRSSRSDCES